MQMGAEFSNLARQARIGAPVWRGMVWYGDTHAHGLGGMVNVKDQHQHSPRYLPIDPNSSGHHGMAISLCHHCTFLAGAK